MVEEARGERKEGTEGPRKGGPRDAADAADDKNRRRGGGQSMRLNRLQDLQRVGEGGSDDYPLGQIFP